MVLAKGLCFVATQFSCDTSVLLMELNVYTIMFPYLPDATKWRFPLTITKVQYCTEKEREIVFHISLTSYKESIIYPSSFGFYLNCAEAL